ncbi:unnamed protein product [Victoria cruziana]
MWNRFRVLGREEGKKLGECKGKEEGEKEEKEEEGSHFSSEPAWSRAVGSGPVSRRSGVPCGYGLESASVSVVSWRREVEGRRTRSQEEQW